MFSSTVIVSLAFLHLGSCCANGGGGNPAIGSGLHYHFGGTINTRELKRDSPSEKVARPSDLDCANFVNCRWKNVADDELDWSRSVGVPNSIAWERSMNTRAIPAGESTVLVSPFRPASDNGRLVSDPIGCMFSPINVTLTMWKNIDRTGRTLSAKLSVCSRLVGESGALKADQCTTVNGENGRPTSVSVRPPVEGGPAELVIVGDNFVTLPFGGAIFVREVKVNGRIGPDCSSDPGLETNRPLGDANADEQQLVSAFDARKLADSNVVDACEQLSFSPDIADKWDTPLKWRSRDGVFAGWRFAKDGGNVDDPSTLNDIRKGPSGVDQFAIASFGATPTTDGVFFHLVSRAPVNVPSDGTDYYYCFDQVMTSPAVALQLCEDAELTKCFYHSAQRASSSGAWTRNCAKLPIGTFKVYVIAQYDKSLSSPMEKSEVGFVPDVVTTDAEGISAAC
uniref:Uncharacterized protein n=1 Tax=Plectus sambesii TaxID=2011161 RepID=A0A914X156_9BILA